MGAFINRVVDRIRRKDSGVKPAMRPENALKTPL
jgi:hypothetical protein